MYDSEISKKPDDKPLSKSGINVAAEVWHSQVGSPDALEAMKKTRTPDTPGVIEMQGFSLLRLYDLKKNQGEEASKLHKDESAPHVAHQRESRHGIRK